jgi:hypothetical protein
MVCDSRADGEGGRATSGPGQRLGVVVQFEFIGKSVWYSSCGVQNTAPYLGPQMEAAIGRMIVVMMDANHISERLASMRQEMSDLGTSNARYWSKRSHTALEKSASALRRDRLVEIKLELADMMKRCA